MIREILHQSFLGNTLENIAWFVGIILAGLMFQRLLSKLFTLFVFKFLQKYTTGVGYNKLLVLLKKPMGVFILLLSLYFAFDRLNFPAEWNLVSIDNFGLRLILFRSFQLTMIGSITWIFLRLIDFFGLVLMYRASLTESKTDDQLVPFFIDSIKVILVTLSIFFVFGTVFKMNVASLIAGLGIGGLAIALAAKESLENLLGSFTIFLDKPFVIGDLIQIGNLTGNVEKIGFRSTRIRTPEKSYVTVPNKKLVDGELDNLSLRTQRRAKFNVGLTYETKPEQLKNIAFDLENFINNHPHILKGETRVCLHDFDSSAINIMVVYFVDTMEYDIYLRVRQEINYIIIEIVNKHGASFAVQTASLLVKK